ncbi:substrate-binding domain-containing protein [Streptomyces sp. CT34]|uniref:LacI family DNA-binding transcriptional regulator n=1 Tax=Streptomyces sp. CT34 TaxID=1553907 RepID=UPI00068E6D1E|nr:substrate-binding domain-containing protein [Streptomyces sp. CT34]
MPGRRSSSGTTVTSGAADPAARITIAEIAREAGVSAPTVSKVLNGRDEVAPETRARVEELLQRHNYLRRRARPKKTVGLVDLVIREVDSLWAGELMQGVQSAAAEHGSEVVVTATHGTTTHTRRWLDRVSQRGSDGVILAVTDLTPAQRKHVNSLDIPLALIDPVGSPDTGVPTVGATNWQGGMAATQHLINLGHRRIGILQGLEETLSARARLDGYRAALEGAGLAVDPALQQPGNFYYTTGFSGMRDLLALADPPTAVFASSDLMALGAYEAIRQAGLRVATDVSIVGFDDVPNAAWASPPLTTVRQPLREMAALAARIVLQGADAVLPGPTLRMELATHLVVRESTGAAPGVSTT